MQPIDFTAILPAGLSATCEGKTLPQIAKDKGLTAQIEAFIRQMPTRHRMLNMDARLANSVFSESVQLVLTSPPYWNIKQYEAAPGQLGAIDDYRKFLEALDAVWAQCYRILAPGGRLAINVGDVLLSRKKNGGEHMVMPLHASIQERCRALGFTNLSPIIWNKIGNAGHEVAGGGAMLGRPYEPNAIIKNEIEFILLFRKPGPYRKVPHGRRIMSIIPEDDYKIWFQQIWSDIRGASTRGHPAPYPLALAERLIRMFSFVGDTVCDVFSGSATTSLAAARWGRNSLALEVSAGYHRDALIRLAREMPDTARYIV